MDERPRRRPSEEELALWHEVARRVVPLPGRDAPPAARIEAPARKAAPAAGAVTKPEAGSARAAPAAPLRVPPGRHAPTAGLDRRLAERLRRGRLPIESRIDLHGLTQAEAHLRLDAFLAGAHRSGKRCVLVITGKGTARAESASAPGGRFALPEARGVLRQLVPRWLGEGANARRVLAIAPAQPRHGGEGALYVYLRRPR